MSVPWFEPTMFGSTVGSLIGIAGGVYGTLVGIVGGVFLPRGKGKGILVGVLASTVVVGLALLGVGFYALADGQPRDIWYVLILGGSIFSVVGGIQLLSIRLVIRRLERRKMEADDLRRL